MNKIRVRFAPSPTGFMHVGNFRSALYDYLYAKKNGGDFVLRIEDTDRKRFVEGAIESLIKTLDWAGLKPDEGVFSELNSGKFPELSSEKCDKSKKYPGILEIGDYGPYIQSEKLEVYKKYAEELVKKGHAYYCFCSAERLETMKQEQIMEKQPPMYDRYCLNTMDEKEIQKKLAENCPFAIRLKIPKGEIIEINDIVRGRVIFNTDILDDQVLLKSDGFPTYHLANVIDDHDMRITHVIRGEEWLPSLPKHILLYRYFGWDTPQFAHLPLLLNPDKTKLSKRQGDVAVEDYIKKGYLREAIINFVALLGWNPGGGETQEIFTLEELVEKFELERVHKAGAVFDIKKLDWINSQWIKKISVDELYERGKEFFAGKDFIHNASDDKKSEAYLKKVLMIERERLQKLSEVGENNRFFFQEISYDKELLRWKDMDNDNLISNLEKAQRAIENINDNDWDLKNIEVELMTAAGENRGEFLWPLRVALTGEKKSPSPFEVAWVLGKAESLKRIDQALQNIKKTYR